MSSALPGIQLHSYVKTKVNGFALDAKEIQFNYAPLWQVFSCNYTRLVGILDGNLTQICCNLSLYQSKLPL